MSDLPPLARLVFGILGGLLLMGLSSLLIGAIAQGLSRGGRELRSKVLRQSPEKHGDGEVSLAAILPAAVLVLVFFAFALRGCAAD